MAFTLKIHFVGLIAWVFKRMNGELSEGRALLLSSDEYQLSNGEMLQPHYPGLLFGAEEVKGDSLPAPSNDFMESVDLNPWSPGQKSPLGTKQWGALELDDQRVWLELPSGDPIGIEPETGHRPTHGTGRQPLPTGRVMRSDVSFLTSMNELCVDSMSGGDGRLQGVPIVDPKCFEMNPSQFHYRVAAAFDVPCGHLTVQRLGEIPGANAQATHSATREAPSVIPACRFEPSDPGGPQPTMAQAVADHMLVTIPSIQGNQLNIHVDSASKNRTIELTPMDGIAGDEGVIVLFVGNRPKPSYVSRGMPAWHFEAYYELSKSPVAKRFRPIPYPDAGQVRSSEINGRFPIQPFQNREPDADPVAEPAAASSGRPICPQATFTPLE